MDKQTLHKKKNAYEYAYKHEDAEWCHCILAELEAENYHKLVELLCDCKWQAVYEWIEANG